MELFFGPPTCVLPGEALSRLGKTDETAFGLFKVDVELICKRPCFSDGVTSGLLWQCNCFVCKLAFAGHGPAEAAKQRESSRLRLLPPPRSPFSTRF